MNYDPNLTNSGNMADQTVKLTFGLWCYRAERTVIVGGNCRGFDVIKSAIRIAYDNLESEEIRPFGESRTVDVARITLTNRDGDEMECEDEEEGYEDWLGNMLIGAEIVAIEPQKEAE